MTCDERTGRPTAGKRRPLPAAAPAPQCRSSHRRAAGPSLAIAAAAATCAALLLPAGVLAQTTGDGSDYPSKTIRFVVPYAAGGPLDQAARVLAEEMRGSLGQPVIVENKPGAGGNIGADNVAKSAPDGYSIVMGAVATHAINPYLYKKMPYDANRDFTPITRVAVVPNVLVVTPQWATRNKVDSVASLLAYARANPGKLNYGSGGNGSAGHLAGELFKSMADVSMVHIPYKGAAPAKMELIERRDPGDVRQPRLRHAADPLGATEGAGRHHARSAPRPSPTCRRSPRAASPASTSAPGSASSRPAGLATPVLDRLYQAARRRAEIAAQ